MTVTREAGQLRLPDSRMVSADTLLPGIADGVYRIGFRVEDAILSLRSDAPLAFRGTVAVTEISGSESFVHLDTGFATWVSLVLGVHEWRPGLAAEIRIDPARIFVFDEAGALIRAPELPAAQPAAMV
jgi:glycerol transport system ATP-binding protein